MRALPGLLSHLTSGQHQSEDCLFLNVYTKQVAIHSKQILNAKFPCFYFTHFKMFNEI